MTTHLLKQSADAPCAQSSTPTFLIALNLVVVSRNSFSLALQQSLMFYCIFSCVGWFILYLD